MNRASVLLAAVFPLVTPVHPPAQQRRHRPPIEQIAAAQATAQQSVVGTWDMVTRSHAGTYTLVRGLTEKECSTLVDSIGTVGSSFDSEQEFGVATARCFKVS